MKLLTSKKETDVELLLFLLDSGYDLTYEWKEFIKPLLSSWKKPLTDCLIAFIQHRKIKDKLKKRLLSKFLVFASKHSQISVLLSLGADPFMTLNKHVDYTCLHCLANHYNLATWKIFKEQMGGAFDTRRIMGMKDAFHNSPIERIRDKKILLEIVPEAISFKFTELQSNYKVLGDSAKCAICFSEYIDPEEQDKHLIFLSCKHAFHLSCFRSVPNLRKCLYCKHHFNFEFNKS